ncbi:MAG: hypothetical protein Q7K39_04265 [Candidatus Magasanikbacteria bacterium]|nr:hypothetical protein [Candidatus Magasanikbacteria bacterium]
MLTEAAQKIISDYLALPFPSGPVQCPYYNNDRLKLRAGLRAHVGKGSPADIVEEAHIVSLHEKIDLAKLSPEAIKKFLVEHRLGVDCSGFVYYILDAELKARGQGGLASKIKFTGAQTPWRKILARLRPPENTGVATLGNDQNSYKINLSEAKPGDFIIMRAPEKNKYISHVVLIEKVTTNNNGMPVLGYIHSVPWKSDGRYESGVRRGHITVTKPSGNLLEQTWEEKNAVNNQNETYAERAKLASILELRRLRALA